MRTQAAVDSPGKDQKSKVAGHIKISPSLLAVDFAHLADSIAAVEEAGADELHLDVMDGNFVPNITVGIPVLEAIRPLTDLPIDVHMMVVEPEALRSRSKTPLSDGPPVTSAASRTRNCSSGLASGARRWRMLVVALGPSTSMRAPSPPLTNSRAINSCVSRLILYIAY